MWLKIAARFVPQFGRAVTTKIVTPIRLYSGDIAGPKKLDAFGKRIMVIGGAFKNVKDVPDVVSHAQYTKCSEKFRIKLNIAAIFCTLAACVYAMGLGRDDHAAGKSLHNEVLKRHAESRAEGQQNSVASAGSS